MSAFNSFSAGLFLFHLRNTMTCRALKVNLQYEQYNYHLGPLQMLLTTAHSNAAFTCYRNYRKYELPSRKLDMNSLREALCGQFPTRKLVFTIIPIARECSINPQENHKCNPQAEQPQGFVNQSSTSWSKSIIFATGEIHFIKSF